MAVILQLGAGEWMKHSIRQIKALGHQVYAVDKNPNAPAFAVSDGFAPIDLIDIEGITNYAREIGADAILAANEAGVLAAANASLSLGLRGLHPDTAIKALDKGLMREAWETAQLSQPRFIIVDSLEKVAHAAETIGYPLILKPTRNWGSRGISRVDKPDELAWAMDFAAKYQKSGRFIVEEFIDGTEMTVEGLIQDGQVSILAVSDKEHQAHPHYRVTMGINYPANFSPEIYTQIEKLVADAALALGLDNSALHAEAMLSKGRVYLIEMACRPGGGHIFGQIVEASSGISMPQALAGILLGEKVDIRPKYRRGTCYRFFAPPAGIFLSVEGIEEARNLEGILDFGFHLATGTKVVPLESGADRPGYCVSTGETREDAMALADKAVALLRFKMEADL